jgi:hypothetical protein
MYVLYVPPLLNLGKSSLPLSEDQNLHPLLYLAAERDASGDSFRLETMIYLCTLDYWDGFLLDTSF